MSDFTADDDALLAELGVEVELKPQAKRTAREERIIAGFEEIQRFVDEHGHSPAHGEGKDIFERIYAKRLDRIRDLDEASDLLAPMDHQGLLDQNFKLEEEQAEFSDEELLAELGVEVAPEKDVTALKHVQSRAEKRAAEEIANRQKCDDFDEFQPLFDAVQNQLDTGARETKRVRKDAGFAKTDIREGQFFILGGQIAYVAEVGELFAAPNGEADARMRVIYANGTESDLLLRSMQRALYKDESSRIISDPAAGPLFSGTIDEEDAASGTIYVLRSKSELQIVKDNREVLHKIGVTNGKVERRIANASSDATFLLADVEVVATYELFNINRTKLENLIHRIFDAARLDIEIKDRFGNPVVPREWFLVPFAAVDDAVKRIQDGTITKFVYDPSEARLVER